MFCILPVAVCVVCDFDGTTHSLTRRLSQSVRSDGSELRSELARAQASLLELSAQKELAQHMWQALKKEKSAAELNWYCTTQSVCCLFCFYCLAVVWLCTGKKSAKCWVRV